MARFTLTVRHGAKVERERFDRLEEAVDEMRRRAEAIRAEGPLPGVRALRDFAPADRVAGRLELSTRAGLLRRREAGLDVRGDGSLVAYAGAISKRELAGPDVEVFEAISRELAGA